MAPEKPRLTRPRQGAWIGGVCAGIARRFGWSPGWVRVGYVAISIVPLVPGILVYILLWLVIPREETEGAPKEVLG